MAHHDDSSHPALPDEPIQKLLAPLARFLHVEAAGGAVLLVASVVALVLANSPLSEAYLAFWKTPFEIGFGETELDHSLKHWINDGLMGIFFFVMGLEVKRELVLGELRDLRRAALPIAAAIGGMLVPAGVYLFLEGSGPYRAGWGIPMATDIAFVIGCLAILGSRVPPSLRVMLVSLAIADDIGAILVIAIGYTAEVDLVALLLGFVGIGLVRVMALSGVRSIGAYVLVGGLVWLAFHESGVHATIAGVILGLLTPAKEWVDDNLLHQAVERTGDFLRGDEAASEASRVALMQRVSVAARESVSPLVRLETALHPWVAFAIMPIFALANAGVVVEASAFTNSVAWAIGAGLLIGKPVGILGMSWLAVRLGIAQRPDDVGWDLILAGGFLAGIGFTMSLFISALALPLEIRDAAKLGILVASILAGALGLGLLWVRLPRAADGSD